MTGKSPPTLVRIGDEMVVQVIGRWHGRWSMFRREPGLKTWDGLYRKDKFGETIIYIAIEEKNDTKNDVDFYVVFRHEHRKTLDLFISDPFLTLNDAKKHVELLASDRKKYISNRKW